MRLHALPLLISCLTVSLHALAIHDGENLSDMQKPEVLRIYSVPQNTEIKNLDSFRQAQVNWCTGVAVSDRTAMTAGHCVYELDSPDVLTPYFVQFESDNKSRIVKSISVQADQYQRVEVPEPYENIIYHPDYVKGCRPGPVPLVETPYVDLALVNFPPGTFSSWLEVDVESETHVGDKIEYWGFGAKNNSLVNFPMGPTLRNGALSRAENIVIRENAQRIAFWNKPHNTWADSGDSGGPVLRNGKVVAILSTRHEKCETQYGEDYMMMNTATRVQKLINPPAK